ncbi:acyltransferase [Pseudoalteromonas lipolytica]|uniref:acyltransferase n=1 Tax=Pseudoalteromonas lipolytica TaxID=570156 RepID=UPI003BA25151
MFKRKLSILYAFLVRSVTYFLPDIPLFMRFRGALYSVMMKSSGSNFQVAHSVILNSISKLEVGSNVYIANNCSLLCGGGVSIDCNVMLAPGVVISSDNHTYTDDGGYRFGEAIFSMVEIHKNSWICANSVIVSGSIILEGTIIGPGSTCIKGAVQESHSLYSGVPVKFIKSLDGVKE